MPAPKGHAPYPGCEKGGRPKKYTTEFIEAEADGFVEWMKREDSIWYKDFALERGYLSERFLEWKQENEKFASVYKQAQEWQQSKLLKGGLLNKYNAGFAKFVMGNTCGWSDKQNTQLSGDTISPLTFMLQKLDGASKDLVND